MPKSYTDWVDSLYEETAGAEAFTHGPSQLARLSSADHGVDRKFDSLNPLGLALDVISLPGDVVRSTLKEGIDAIAGKGFSFSDWGDQISKGITTGEIMQEYDFLQGGGWWSPERWLGRAVGLVGDVGLDPISYVGGPGVAALARGGARKIAAAAAVPNRARQIKLTVAARKGDTTATGMQKTLSAAQKRFDDADAALSRTPSDDVLRKAQESAQHNLNRVGKTVDDYFAGSQMNAHFDDVIHNLTRPGGGIAAVTDDVMMEAILGTSKVTGMRIRPNFIPGRIGEQGGIQIMSAATYEKFTRLPRALRGKITGTKWWAKAPFRRETARKLTQFAQDTANIGPPGSVAAKWGLIGSHDVARKQTEQLVRRATAAINSLETVTRNTDEAKRALFRAAQSPPADWEADGTLAALRAAGVEDEHVAGLRNIYDDLWGTATRFGADLGDLRGGYLPSRKSQTWLRKNKGSAKADRVAKFERTREIAERSFGEKVLTVEAGLAAGTLGKTADGQIFVRAPEEFNWTRLWDEMDDIARRNLGDEFDPDFFERNPFELTRMYIGEWGRSLESRMFQNAALENGLATWADDVAAAGKVGELLDETPLYDSVADDIKALIGSAEQAADRSLRANAGEIADDVAALAQQNVRSEWQRLAIKLGHALREHSSLESGLGGVVGKELTPAVENRLRRTLSVINEQLNKTPETAGPAQVARDTAVSNRWEDRLALNTDIAAGIRRASQTVQSQVLESGAAAARPQITQAAQKAQAGLRSFVSDLSNDLTELSANLKAATELTDFDDIAANLDTALIQWQARADEFATLRPSVAAVDDTLRAEWEDQMAVVEGFIHAEVSRLAKLKDEALKGVKKTVTGDATPTTSAKITPAHLQAEHDALSDALVAAKEAADALEGGLTKATDHARAAADRAAERYGIEAKYAGRAFEETTLDPTELVVAPNQLNIKSWLNDEGQVFESLAGTKGWNPAGSGVMHVFEASDGVRYVVDGHQRLALARRLLNEGTSIGVDGQPIRLRADVFREADGWTDEAVAALAAQKNVIEGSVLPVDYAKWLKRASGEAEDVARLAPSTTNTAQLAATSLSKLEPSAFDVLNAAIDAGTNPSLMRPEMQAVFGRIATEWNPVHHELFVRRLLQNLPSSPEVGEVFMDTLPRFTRYTREIPEDMGFADLMGQSETFVGLLDELAETAKGMGASRVAAQVRAFTNDPELLRQLSTADGQARMLARFMFRTDEQGFRRTMSLRTARTSQRVTETSADALALQPPPRAGVDRARDNFHYYVANYYNKLTPQQKAKLLADEVAEQLDDLGQRTRAAQQGDVAKAPPPAEPPPVVEPGQAVRPRATPDANGSLWDVDDIAPEVVPPPKRAAEVPAKATAGVELEGDFVDALPVEFLATVRQDAQASLGLLNEHTIIAAGNNAVEVDAWRILNEPPDYVKRGTNRKAGEYSPNRQPPKLLLRLENVMKPLRSLAREKKLIKGARGRITSAERYDLEAWELHRQMKPLRAAISSYGNMLARMRAATPKNKLAELEELLAPITRLHAETDQLHRELTELLPPDDKTWKALRAAAKKGNYPEPRAARAVPETVAEPAAPPPPKRLPQPDAPPTITDSVAREINTGVEYLDAAGRTETAEALRALLRDQALTPKLVDDARHLLRAEVKEIDQLPSSAFEAHAAGRQLARLHDELEVGKLRRAAPVSETAAPEPAVVADEVVEQVSSQPVEEIIEPPAPPISGQAVSATDELPPIGVGDLEPTPATLLPHAEAEELAKLSPTAQIAFSPKAMDDVDIHEHVTKLVDGGMDVNDAVSQTAAEFLSRAQRLRAEFGQETITQAEDVARNQIGIMKTLFARRGLDWGLGDAAQAQLDDLASAYADDASGRLFDAADAVDDVSEFTPINDGSSAAAAFRRRSAARGAAWQAESPAAQAARETESAQVLTRQFTEAADLFDSMGASEAAVAFRALAPDSNLNQLTEAQTFLRSVIDDVAPKGKVAMKHLDDDDVQRLRFLTRLDAELDSLAAKGDDAVKAVGDVADDVVEDLRPPSVFDRTAARAVDDVDGAEELGKLRGPSQKAIKETEDLLDDVLEESADIEDVASALNIDTALEARARAGVKPTIVDDAADAIEEAAVAEARALDELEEAISDIPRVTDTESVALPTTQPKSAETVAATRAAREAAVEAHRAKVEAAEAAARAAREASEANAAAAAKQAAAAAARAEAAEQAAEAARQVVAEAEDVVAQVRLRDLVSKADNAADAAVRARTRYDDLVKKSKKTEPPLRKPRKKPSPTELVDRIRKARRSRSAERQAFRQLAKDTPTSATAYSNDPAEAAFNLHRNVERTAEATRELETATKPAQRARLNAEIQARTEAGNNLQAAQKLAEQIDDPEVVARVGDIAGIQYNADTAAAEAIRTGAVPPTFNTEQIFETGEQAAAAFVKDVTHIADKFIEAGKHAHLGRRVLDETTGRLARWQDVMVPTEVAEAFEAAGRTFEFGKFGTYMKTAVDWWRGIALLSPRYHTRNFIGAMFSNWVAGVRLKDMRRVASEYRRMLRGLDPKDVPVRDYLEEMQRFGVLSDPQVGGGGFFGTEIDHATSGQRTWNPFNPKRQWKPVAFNRQISGHIEQVVRGAAGWRAVQRMGAGANAGAQARALAASNLIDRLHFNYSDLSDFEQRIRNVIPFWTWTSRNIPLTVMTFTHRPQAVLLAEKVFKNIGGGAPFNPFVPEYFEENRYVQLSQEWFATPELPYMAAIKDVGRLTGEWGNPMAAAVELNPWFRSALELVTGRDAFRGYAIEGTERWTRAFGDMIPPLAQVRRLAPQIVGGSESEESRAMSSWLSWLGVPLRKVSDWERQAEMARLSRNLNRPSAAEAAARQAQAEARSEAERNQRVRDSESLLQQYASAGVR